MKKTKKFLVGLLSFLVVLTCPLVLTSCKKECKEHTWGEWTEVTSATCTQDGTKTHKCSKCDKEETETVKALGHDYQTPVYVWSEDSLTCTATRTCSRDAEHVETETVDSVFVGTPATCEQAGHGHYEATFTNTAFVKQQTQDKDVDALGHKYVTVYTWAEDNSTCTATATCEHDNTHVITETADSVYEVVSPAECEKEGEGKYSVIFKNAELFETQYKTKVIEALKHTYGTPIYVWTEEVVDGVISSTCTATRTCGIDGSHKETETKTVVVSVTTNPTCTETGEGTATVVFENSAFGTQTKNYVIDALGHDLHRDDENSTQATCKTNGTNHMVCSRCDFTRDDVVLASTVEHTWEGDGVRDCEHGRTCSVCGTVEPALGHNTVLDTEKSERATCEADGKNVFTCQREGCTYSYSNPIPKTGHNIEGVEPTQRAVEGKPCTYVNVYICKNGDHEVLGTEFVRHNYIARIKTAATCTTSGVKTYTCSGCGDHYDETYAASSSAHDWVESSTEPGHFTCNNCSETKVVIDNSSSKEAVVSKDSITSKSEIVLSGASITVDSTTLAKANGNVTLSADKLEGDARNEVLANHADVADQIGDKPIYNFTMSDSTGKVDFSESSVTITIPYTLGENEDVDSIFVWYLSDDGTVSTIKATYHNGTIIFTTNHFSYYTTINLTPEQICAQGEHSYVSKVVEPTCTEAGYTIKTCSRCGHTETVDPKPAKNHSYHKDFENSYDATCTTDGQTVMVCDCGSKLVTVLPATGHSFVKDTVNSIPASCGVAGKDIYVCEHDNCTETYTKYLVALDHEYDEGVYTNHTQTEVGFTTYTCSKCNHSYDVKDKDFNHKFNVEHATCKTDKVCEICNLVAQRHEDVEHTYDEGVYTNHTQTEVGFTTYTCTVCGHSYTEQDTEIKHSFNVEHADCGNDKVCTICNLLVESHENYEHNFVDGVCSICQKSCEHGLGDNELFSVDATCTEEGYTYYICDDCGTKVIHEKFEPHGHEGLIVCQRCEQEVMSKEVFVNAFRYIQGNKFTLKLENVLLSLQMSENKQKISLPFAELYIGKDDNGELYAFGTVKIDNYTPSFKEIIPGEIESVDVSVVIKNNKLYLKAITDTSSTLTTSDDKAYYTFVEGDTIYACFEVSDMIDYIISNISRENNIPEGVITMDSINTIIDWCRESLLPYVNNIIDKNLNDVVDLFTSFAGDYCNVVVTNEGYIFKINSSSLTRLFNDITTLSVEEFINKKLGENKYDQIIEGGIEMLLSGKTVGDVIYYLKTRGLDVYGLIDIANILVPKLAGGMTLDEIVYGLIQSGSSSTPNTEMQSDVVSDTSEDESEEIQFSLKGYIASFETMELREILLQLISNSSKDTANLLRPYLYPDLNETTMEEAVKLVKTFVDGQVDPYLSDMTIFELLYNLAINNKGEGNTPSGTEGNEETSQLPTAKEIIEKINECLSIIDQFFSFRIETNLAGDFKSFSFALNTPVAEASIKATLLVGSVTDIDYEKVIEDVQTTVDKVALSKDNINNEFNGMGFVEIEDEDGKLIGFEKVYTQEEIDSIDTNSYSKTDENDIHKMTKYTFKFTAVKITIDLTKVLYEMGGYCDGVYHVNPLLNITYQVSYNLTTQTYTKRYSDNYSSEYNNWDYDQGKWYSLTETDKKHETIIDQISVKQETIEYYYLESNNSVKNVYINVRYEDMWLGSILSEEWDDELNRTNGHDYVLESSIEATTCTGVSVYTYVCKNCGRKKIEKAVKGHDWHVDGYVLKEGCTDCEKDGLYENRHCTVCNKVELSENPTMFNHETSNVKYGGEKYGMTLYSCACGKRIYLALQDSNLFSESYNNGVYSYVSGDLIIQVKQSEETNATIYEVYVSKKHVETLKSIA